jgi:hypothetical protein
MNNTAAAGVAPQAAVYATLPAVLIAYTIPAVLKGLFDSLKRAHADPSVKAVVVTGGVLLQWCSSILRQCSACKQHSTTTPRCTSLCIG